jgi:hypothetical protein
MPALSRLESYCVPAGFVVINGSMQISRILPLACAATIFLAPVVLNAQSSSRGLPPGSGIPPVQADPAAIEKAREALRQKMSEVNENGRPATQPPAMPAPEPAARPGPAPEVAMPKPEPRPAQPAVEPYTLTPSDAATSKSAKQIIEEEEKARVAAEKESRRQAADAEKARIAAEKESRKQAAHAEKERVAAEKAAAREAAKSKSTASYTTPNVAPSTPTFAPLSTPATTAAVPSSKEQRLQKLLNDYKSDRISAQEFHEQRAKILAE